MKGIDMRMERKDLEEEVEEFLRSKLEVSAEVVRAREIEDDRVIQARTKEWQDRIKIMENKKKLGDKKIRAYRK